MIIGHLHGWENQKRYLPSPLAQVFNEARARDLDDLAVGKYNLTSVAGAFFLIQEGETKPFAATRPEAHRKFIDIQCLLSGAEKIGMAHGDKNATPLDDRFEQNDIAFYDAPPDEFFAVLSPGQFAVFFPGELHRPFLSPRDESPLQIRKIVIKVPAQALD